MKALLLFVFFCGSICQGQEVDRSKNNAHSTDFTALPNQDSQTNAETSFNNNSDAAYTIRSSSLGLAGTSKTITTQKGSLYVSESIGQRSVIGSFNKNGYSLNQGYQQPLMDIQVLNVPAVNALNAVFYPNPFLQSLNISIETPVTERINILLYDFTGRLVYSRGFPASQFITLELSTISQGVYIIKVTSGNKYVSANLIKN